jgi:hypothetical protein
MWPRLVRGPSAEGQDRAIVDDHAPFRVVARALLALEGFAVVGEAADALSALDAVGRPRSDVVVLDIQLPDLDGSRSPAGWLRPGPAGDGVQPRQLRLPAAACRQPGPVHSSPRATCRAPRSPRWSAEGCACSAWRRPACAGDHGGVGDLPARGSQTRGRRPAEITVLDCQSGWATIVPRVRAIPAARGPAPRHRAACQLLDWPT